MTGSKITAMTLEEMRLRRARGESQTDWPRLRREEAAGVEPVTDNDSPDATAVLREVVARRGAGGAAGSGNKEQVPIGFDRAGRHE